VQRAIAARSSVARRARWVTRSCTPAAMESLTPSRARDHGGRRRWMVDPQSACERGSALPADPSTISYPLP
jgi:hypothetical protein